MIGDDDDDDGSDGENGYNLILPHRMGPVPVPLPCEVGIPISIFSQT